MPTIPKTSQFGVRLVSTARRWRRALDQGLADIGLTDATWVPLVHLQNHGDGMHQKDLALAIGLDTSSLVRLLDVLEARGSIARLPDAQDRRAKRVHLTAQGLAEVDGLQTTLAAISERLLDGVSEADRAKALAIFSQIETNFIS
jgi:MarR family transcriptional regulator for hemolysin